MGFREVYATLRELFPQMDARALRAVAMEHSQDVDAAVVAMLEEIIPFFTKKSTPSSPLSPSPSVSVAGSSEGNPSVDTEVSSQVLNDNNVSRKGKRIEFVESGRWIEIESADDPCYWDLQWENIISKMQDQSESPVPIVIDGNTVEDQTESSEFPQRENACSADGTLESGVEVSRGSSIYWPTEEADTGMSEKLDDGHEKEDIAAGTDNDVSVNTSGAQLVDLPAVGLLQALDMGVDQSSDCTKEMEDITGGIDHDESVNTSESSAKVVEMPTVGILQVLDMNVDPNSDCIKKKGDIAGGTDHDVSVNTSVSSEKVVEMPNMHGSNMDNSELFLSTDSVASNSVVTGDGSTLNGTMSSQESQDRMADVIDEVIADARNNKKRLLMEMESVTNLMKQVEIKEKDAEEAKREAEIGGMDLLNQVEELKGMLQRTNESNEMNAAEIYSEKAILATELRELQSRVRSLSDERDFSLAILHEMRQSLEIALSAADNEIRSAELKKLEKEEVARKSLVDQELIMEKVVQDSIMLRQQAEDNAKLEEFLLDRGAVVDTLQGEIAVICQDLKLLKERFDGKVPLGKSLISSQTSFILASSVKSLAPDLVDGEKASEDEAEENGWEICVRNECNA